MNLTVHRPEHRTLAVARGWLRPALGWTLCLLLPAAGIAPAGASGFDRESYEEPAGSSFSLFASPDDEIYGVGFGSGTWLKNAPVLGDYLLRMYYHGEERAYYSGIGMTLRLMPRWTYAPYVGGGGNYNYAFAHSGRAYEQNDGRGADYWSGHAEAGLRLWRPHRFQFFEVAFRQTWNAGPRDYPLFFIGFGQGPPPVRRP